MDNLFLIVFLLALLSFVIGLINPNIFKIPTKKLSSKIFGSIIFISFILFGITSPDTPQDQTTESVQTTQVESQNAESAISDTDQNQETSVEETNTSNINEQTNNSSSVQSNTQASPKPSNTSFYSVTQVVDGDTIKVSIDGKEETLRLIGLDTPETVDPRKPVQCFGKEASNKAKELLSGKKVKIEIDSTQGDRDKYGRLLTYVYREDGLFYNKHMIEQGYAHEYTYGTPYKYQSEFKTAQKNAQSSQLGLWSPNTCNGDTTSSATPTTQTTSTANTQSSGGLYYTSSHYSSKYYYPESCTAWKELSPSYLKSYNSLDALLVAYPSKTKSPSCD
jgi:micrococcal nuclease